VIVDCDSCVVRGDACGDCMISVLLGAPPTGVAADGPERLALDALAHAGMVPRLRFVPLNSVLPERGSAAGSSPIAERSKLSDKRSQEQAS
jgi:hypothetical protein